ncbi:MAG TPA: protein ndvB, partial [Chitinophagaceae bacterium]|nr:protein ndvB [Chitinophagaceae bacterium]
DLAEALEVRFLANRDKNLHFGLLTDLKDSPVEKTEADEKLIALTVKKIRELNIKYPGADNDTFFLFHRPRRWNPADRIWMGYERKRGKLADLNALIMENKKKNFSHVIGHTEILKTIRYVITLDTDTLLPRDTAKQLVGTMAHPLNRPYFDPKKQRVTDGYTILQPRVAVSLPGTNRSRFAKLFGSEPGIDPYTRAVSDVYQDLFGEGSFIGKGIYDVEYFERSLKGRFPENRILSHDLLEGCYGRSGLLSDVMLFEEYPERYESDVRRRSRWIRGDWQLLPWLFPVLPRVSGSSRKNPISLLSWWKIFDNLRRSLVPVALLLLLVSGWTFLPSPVYWTLIVIAIIAVPALITGAVYLYTKPEDVIMQQHLKSAGKLGIQHLQQTIFTIISLPFEAWYTIQAISRTLWRLFISKKNLLEWNPAANTGSPGYGIDQSYRFMWFSTFLAAVTTAYLLVSSPLVFLLAWPFIAAWFLFPAIAWWISLIIEPGMARLNARQDHFLRDLARRTWFFFETYVGPEDNWLPPDNYQEDPGSITAHRTSPTNVGLSLLAGIAAYDFGYIYTGELLERTSNTFHTMNLLERYNGHFLNWYDTKSLKPLHPLYVS